MIDVWDGSKAPKSTPPATMRMITDAPTERVPNKKEVLPLEALDSLDVPLWYVEEVGTNMYVIDLVWCESRLCLASSHPSIHPPTSAPSNVRTRHAAWMGLSCFAPAAVFHAIPQGSAFSSV